MEEISDDILELVAVYAEAEKSLPSGLYISQLLSPNKQAYMIHCICGEIKW